ncbi:androgen-dependent TFPI-regulating protein-like [Plodia interpunctella]|uniref:androgen-dependent TFPI-regulating protein-like n=1 Tax=Plodia interpunctella TaxID=58824 RepID=UPI0023676A5A|nr:androgen-dependent TFPI-regulating protein-like [Plodia interpunctella]
MLRPVFHLSVVALNVFSLWYDQNYLDFPFPAEGYSRMTLKGRLMFLTMWCFILQTLYFTVSLLNDILGTNATALAPKKTPLIRSIKDLMFSLAFPVALYVSIAFWGIYAIDKNLVFPEHIEKIFPVWFNHTLHTLIAIFMFIELFVTNKTYPSRKFGIFLTVTYTLSYVVWLHILRERTGMWVYPIFEVLNLPQRVVYFASSTAVAAGFYIFGEKINSAVAKKSNNPYANGRVKKNK